MTSTRDRLRRWAEQRWSLPSGSLGAKDPVLSVDDACAFAEHVAAEDVHAALAPRDPSPELVEAEQWLLAWFPAGGAHSRCSRALHAEMDRLRARKDDAEKLCDGLVADKESLRRQVEADLTPDEIIGLILKTSGDFIDKGWAIANAQKAKREKVAKANPVPAQGERATRVVYWACQSFDEAVRWSRTWPGPAHGFKEHEGAGSVAELIAKHPAHAKDEVFKVTTIVERVDRKEEP